MNNTSFALDSRGKRIEVGDIVAYPATGVVYAYSSSSWAKISKIEPNVDSTDPLDHILSFEGKKCTRVARQVLKLEQ